MWRGEQEGTSLDTDLDPFSQGGKEGGGGDVLKVVQIEGVVELALGQNIHGFMLVTRTRFLRQQIENREISTREVIRSL